MTILINRTFEIVTEESAEDGDCAESGFLSQDEPVTFKELVELLEGGEPSSWPATGCTHDWVTQDQGETREWFESGERESHSIHYSKKNPPHNDRYWRLAFKAAGLCK